MIKFFWCIPAIFISVLMISCSSDTSLCKNSEISKITSPNKDYVAHIFTRDCGATTKINYQLSILKKGESLNNETGNVFVSYGNFNAEWTNPNELLVIYKKSDRVFKNERKIGEIEIKYSN